MPFSEYLADRVRHSFKENKTGFEEKKMFGGLCFFVDDKMCCGVFKEELMVRIDPANEDEYLKAVYDFVSSIKNDQTEYLEEWALEIPLDERKIDALLEQIDQLINTPQSERTYYNYE